MSNLKYWLWLSSRKGLLGQNLLRTLRYFGTPERVYFADRGEYELMGGLSREVLRSLEDKSLDQADRILGRCDALGIQVMTMQDAAYPERLAAIHQPPLVLYWKGRQVAFDEEAAIAIVGTRSATPYGVRAAARLSMDLTRAGALIVSGIAQGIDAAAIRAALKAGSPVVSVLGGGIDVIYPKEHWGLYEDVAAAGTLISEYPPGTEHWGAHFPVRNRIISGLSVGVVAVESGRTGGTLHTVGHALEQDREVFAVPGPIDAPSSEGTNRLIQEGAAKLVMGAEDILCELVSRFPKLNLQLPLPDGTVEQRLELEVKNIPSPKGKEETGGEKAVEKEVDIPTAVEYIDWQECKRKLTDDQQEVLLALGERDQKADDLIERTQIPARRVLSALTILQLMGYVEEGPGKRFRAAVRLKME